MVEFNLVQLESKVITNQWMTVPLRKERVSKLKQHMAKRPLGSLEGAPPVEKARRGAI